MSETFAELFEQSVANQTFKPGSIIKADVVAVNNDVVVVNAGLKSEAAIPIIQFQNDDGEIEVAVGDQVDVALDALEDGFGSTRLSREKAKRAETWTYLERAEAANEMVEGIISSRVKGGFTVDIGQVRAFLPGSLVDIRPTRDTSYLEGKKLEFKVIKLDAKRNNVVVSRRAVLEEENSVDRDAIIEQLQDGAVVEGVVKNLTEYGAFVDLGGLDGLLHITDMSWKRIKHPSEVVNVGDTIDVKVLRFDRERMRVSLGMKQLADDPWQAIDRRYPVNARLFGKITNVADYGCFVELEDGVEGLVHVSEMDWTNKNINPAKLVQVGDEVEVMVLEIDEDRRRISLGLKQCKSNPWEEFAIEHAKGDRITGTIRSITDFGIFVGLPGDIDGLIHLSDLSWDIPGEEAVREFSKGQELEAVILLMEADRGRISLGLKQMDDDPFAHYISEHPKGSVVSGAVLEVDVRTATIDLAEGIQGVIRANDLKEDRVEDARAVVKAGETLEAVIVNWDRKNRQVQLSVKAKNAKEEADAMQDYQAGSSSGTSLGSLLKEKISAQNGG